MPDTLQRSLLCLVGSYTPHQNDPCCDVIRWKGSPLLRCTFSTKKVYQSFTDNGAFMANIIDHFTLLGAAAGFIHGYNYVLWYLPPPSWGVTWSYTYGEIYPLVTGTASSNTSEFPILRSFFHSVARPTLWARWVVSFSCHRNGTKMLISIVWFKGCVPIFVQIHTLLSNVPRYTPWLCFQLFCLLYLSISGWFDAYFDVWNPIFVWLRSHLLMLKYMFISHFNTYIYIYIYVSGVVLA